MPDLAGRKLWVGRLLVEKTWLQHVQRRIHNQLDLKPGAFTIRDRRTASVTYLSATFWQRYYTKLEEHMPVQQVRMEEYVLDALPATKTERATAKIADVSVYDVKRPPLVLRLTSNVIDHELGVAHDVIQQSGHTDYLRPDVHLTIGRFAELDTSLTSAVIRVVEHNLPRSGELTFFEVSNH